MVAQEAKGVGGRMLGLVEERDSDIYIYIFLAGIFIMFLRSTALTLYLKNLYKGKTLKVSIQTPNRNTF